MENQETLIFNTFLKVKGLNSKYIVQIIEK